MIGGDVVPRFQDLSGQKFGKLTVLHRSEDFVRKDGKTRPQWLCKCECGNTVIVLGENLRGGRTTSCGCYRKQVTSSRMKTHGETNTLLYGVWCSMKSRCFNENSTYFSHYGGRGITVCDDWKNDYMSFKSWSESNGYHTGLSIDRIDVNGNYCPENCRWVDSVAQANNRRSNIIIEHNNEAHNLSEWSEITGINYKTLYTRLSSGCSTEELFK